MGRPSSPTWAPHSIEKGGIEGNFDIWNVTVGSLSAPKHQSVNFNCYQGGDYQETRMALEDTKKNFNSIKWSPALAELSLADL